MKQSIIFAALGLAAFGAAAQEIGNVISVVQNRTAGYHVTYEYNGRQYQAQLPTDPGNTIRLRVTPAGEVRPMMRVYRDAAVAAGPVTAPPLQNGQQQRPTYMQQPQQQMQQQPMQQQPMQQQQMQQPQYPLVQQPPARDIARNYGEAVPPEQERQGTNWSATESGNAAMFYGYPHGYGYGYGYPAYPAAYGYPAYPAYGYGYGYPAYPAYGYGYPATVGVAVLPAYRPWVGYRPWGGYYRPWGYGYGPRVSVGIGWRGGWR